LLSSDIGGRYEGKNQKIMVLPTSFVGKRLPLANQKTILLENRFLELLQRS